MRSSDHTPYFDRRVVSFTSAPYLTLRISLSVPFHTQSIHLFRGSLVTSNHFDVVQAMHRSTVRTKRESGLVSDMWRQSDRGLRMDSTHFLFSFVLLVSLLSSSNILKGRHQTLYTHLQYSLTNNSNHGCRMGK